MLVVWNECHRISPDRVQPNEPRGRCRSWSGSSRCRSVGRAGGGEQVRHFVKSETDTVVDHGERLALPGIVICVPRRPCRSDDAPRSRRPVLHMPAEQLYFGPQVFVRQLH